MSCEGLHLSPAQRVDHAHRAADRAMTRYENGHGPFGECVRTQRDYLDALYAFVLDTPEPDEPAPSWADSPDPDGSWEG